MLNTYQKRQKRNNLRINCLPDKIFQSHKITSLVGKNSIRVQSFSSIWSLSTEFGATGKKRTTCVSGCHHRVSNMKNRQKLVRLCQYLVCWGILRRWVWLNEKNEVLWYKQLLVVESVNVWNYRILTENKFWDQKRVQRALNLVVDPLNTYPNSRI